MLRKQKFITREDLQANPDTLYVFGDNERRRGYGGQAKAMRGEPNAVGVRTKRKPARNSPDDFWTDDTYEQNCQLIAEDLAPVFAHLRAGGEVVLPEDGLRHRPGRAANPRPAYLCLPAGAAAAAGNHRLGVFQPRCALQSRRPESTPHNRPQNP